MTVRVLFFAQYRDLAGTDALDLDLDPRPDADAGTTVADVVDALRARGPSWARLPERPAVARNRVVVTLDTRVAHGDELALLPPVAGG